MSSPTIGRFLIHDLLTGKSTIEIKNKAQLVWGANQTLAVEVLGAQKVVLVFDAGKIATTDSSPPYTLTQQALDAVKGGHSITCIAFPDASSNVGKVSKGIVFDVISSTPNPTPTPTPPVPPIVVSRTFQYGGCIIDSSKPATAFAAICKPLKITLLRPWVTTDFKTVKSLGYLLPLLDYFDLRPVFTLSESHSLADIPTGTQAAKYFREVRKTLPPVSQRKHKFKWELNNEPNNANPRYWRGSLQQLKDLHAAADDELHPYNEIICSSATVSNIDSYFDKMTDNGFNDLVDERGVHFYGSRAKQKIDFLTSTKRSIGKMKLCETESGFHMSDSLDVWAKEYHTFLDWCDSDAGVLSDACYFIATQMSRVTGGSRGYLFSWDGKKFVPHNPNYNEYAAAAAA